MQKVLIAGAGKIGTIIAHLLAHSGRYQVWLADINLNHAKHALEQCQHEQLHFYHLDIHDQALAKTFIHDNQIDAIVSCLPYFCNIAVATLAKECNIHYFDPTEDTQTVATIEQLSQHCDKAFVPQCGLAPGFIDIIANDLMHGFDRLDIVKLRCGALPEHSSNALQYALTWSVDGLINEYGNTCEIVQNHELTTTPGLSDIEAIQIDGLSYEAFSTSGGIGTLAKSYQDKVRELNYKTIRYPGHCEKMRFLMYDLKLNQDRDTLKSILQNALPNTKQDVVLIYVSVNGYQNNELHKKNYVEKFYPETFYNLECSAIQATTANGVCAVIDLILSNQAHYHGWIKQEAFQLKDILNGPFGAYLSKEQST